MDFFDKDLASIQESRILMENAKEVKPALANFPQGKFDEVLICMEQAVKDRLNELAELSVEETGYGRSKDEYTQLRLLLSKLSAKLKGTQWVGILDEDKEQKVLDIGVPIGVVVVLLPPVSPAAAVINAAFLCIKTGNAVVFAPHERAKGTIKKVVEILMEAACRAGFPQGAISCLETVAKSGIKELMENPATSLILNMGVKEWVMPAKSPIIYGGTGPSPVFIERTAQIKKAVSHMIESRSFNNGILPAAEQYVIVDRLVEREVKQAMMEKGAYFMSEHEEKKLTAFLCPGNGEMDRESIGKTAAWMANQAGFTVSEGTTVLVSEKRYIPNCNPYSKELRCPVMAYYIENDWMNACEKCMSLLVNKSGGHSLVIHSEDEEVIRQFILKKPVARVLVNAPASFGAMGISTNLFPTAVLGGLTCGMGITADNLSPRNLIYIRKAGYGVETGKEAGGQDEIEEIIKRVLYQLAKEI